MSLGSTDMQKHHCGGQVEVLKWAIENGCKWDCWAARGALVIGHYRTLCWLLARGCTLDADPLIFGKNRPRIRAFLSAQGLLP